MLVWILSIIIILHGLVHLLYAAHAFGILELQPEMPWPQKARFLSSLLPGKVLKLTAGILCTSAGIGFVAGGLAYALSFTAWRTLLEVALTLSIVSYLSLWDGKLFDLDNQGIYAVVIDLALLAVILLESIPLP